MMRISLSFTAAVLLGASVCPAEQFLLIDTTFEHGILEDGERPYNDWQSHLNLRFSDSVPDDWSSPVNYGDGKAHWRIAMMEMASDRDIKWQLCLNNDSPPGSGENTKWHMCCSMTDISEPGVYWNEDGLPWWNWPAPPVWSQWDGYPQAVVKDVNGEPVTNPTVFPRNWEGFPDYELYYPMRLRLTMYVVSAGAEFEPPEWWEDDDLLAGLPVEGCTDSGYAEYDPEATIDDGTCRTVEAVRPNKKGEKGRIHVSQESGRTVPEGKERLYSLSGKERGNTGTLESGVYLYVSRDRQNRKRLEKVVFH